MTPDRVTGTAHAPLADTQDIERRRFVVCGDDKLAFRLVDELISRYNSDVTVIMRDREENEAPLIRALPQVSIIESAHLDADTFRRADLGTAAALALVDQDDGGNVDAALAAQELWPDLRLVLRIFSRSLTDALRETLPGAAVLSAAAMAAPAFVDAALGEGATQIRLRDRTLFETRRGEVPSADVLCGLAVTDGSDVVEMLPLDQARADVVLASSPPRGVRGPGRVRRHRRPFGAVYRMVGRRLWLAFGVVVGLLVAGTGVLAVVKHISWGAAAYLAVINTFGGANADETASSAEKIVQVVLTVASLALVPLVTAAVVDAMVKARLALATGGLTAPTSDHVVVVGLGDIGTRVIRSLHEQGVEVVAIERSADARGVTVARELRIPVIIGDAGRAEVLRSASIGTCRALMVLTSDDVGNLEIALFGRAVKKDLRLVLRMFDGEFARRIQRTFGIDISRSVSYLAAPAFAAAMLGRQVIGTIPVRRRVLLVAELPIGDGSVLEGQTVGDLAKAGESRLLAVRTGRGQQTLWSPADGRLLSRRDRVIVVATRAGLSDLLDRIAPRETEGPAALLAQDPFPTPIHPVG